PHQVTGVGVDNSAPSNGALARTVYAVTFTTGVSTGGLAAAANSQITISFPSGTNLSTFQNAQVFDTSSATPTTSIGFCNVNTTTLVATCFLTGGSSIPAGHNVKVVLNGVTNPSTANSYTLT